MLRHVEDGRELLFLDDEQHTLLRLGEEYLPRKHVGFAERNFFNLDVYAAAALVGDFARRREDARRAHVLHRGDELLVEQVHAALDEELFLERVAYLNLRLARARVLVELARGERRARYAVAARLRAEQHGHVSGLRGLRARHLVETDETRAEGVDERVVVIAGRIEGLAADRRDAYGVAV